MMMLKAWGIAFGLCFLPTLVLAQDDASTGAPINVTTVIGATSITPQDSVLRQDRFFQVPRRIYDASILLEGEWTDVNWRVRGERVAQHGLGGASTGKLALTQAYKNFTSEDQSTTFSIGKRQYSLDQTFIGQPLAFLQKSTDLGDPNDSQGKGEGMPMAALSWAGTQASVVAIISDDSHSPRDGYNSGTRQQILKFGYEFAQSSVALIVRKASGESIGYGATASSSIGDMLTLYGSAYTGKGSLRPILGPLVGAQSDTTLFPTWDSHRADDGVAYPRFTLGATITPQDWPQIQVEYIKDSRGLNAQQFQHLLRLIAPEQGVTTSNMALAMRRAMIASKFPSSGLRQHYAAMNMVYTGDSLSAAAGIYYGLDDSSRVWYGSLNKKWDKSWTITASFSHPQGHANSERGLGFVSTVWSIHLLHAFN